MRGANFMHVKNQKAYIKREKAQSILTLFMKLYFWKKIMADLLLNSLEPGGGGGVMTCLYGWYKRNKIN